MNYNHVLVAIDMTDEADEVLTAARSVADRYGARLSAISVVRPLAGVYGFDMAPVSQGTVPFEQQAIDQARDKMEAFGGIYGIERSDQHVLLGGPAHEIRRASEELEADLIVIGTHGRHGLGRLLGSTANAVLHGVTRDVLVVRIADAS